MRTSRFALPLFAAIAVSAVATTAAAEPPRVAPAHVATREPLPPVQQARPAAVVVSAAHVRALGVKLAAFRGRLGAHERAVMDRIIARAAHGAPDDAQHGIVRSVLFERPGADAAWIAGGIREALGIVAVHRPDPTGTRAIGPKQDDPRVARPGGDVAIGPKQDDPHPPPPGDQTILSLGERLLAFESPLGLQDRAVLGWLFNRASASTPRPGVAPGGLPATSPEGLLAAGLRLDANAGQLVLRPSDLVGVWYPIDRPRPSDQVGVWYPIDRPRPADRGGHQNTGPTDGPGSGVGPAGPGAAPVPR